MEVFWNCWMENLTERGTRSRNSFGPEISIQAENSTKNFPFSLCWLFRSRAQNRFVARSNRKKYRYNWPTKRECPRSDLINLALLRFREKVRIKTGCRMLALVLICKFRVRPVTRARKLAFPSSFSCNPLFPLHNSMTFGTTFAGLFPRWVFWMFYMILRLPRIERSGNLRYAFTVIESKFWNTNECSLIKTLSIERKLLLHWSQCYPIIASYGSSIGEYRSEKIQNNLWHEAIFTLQ